MLSLSNERVVDGELWKGVQGQKYRELVPKGRGPPPPDTTSHLLKLLSNGRCIATGFIKFFLGLQQVLLRVVVRMNELMNEFSGLFAHETVWVGGNIG